MNIVVHCCSENVGLGCESLTPLHHKEGIRSRKNTSFSYNSPLADQKSIVTNCIIHRILSSLWYSKYCARAGAIFTIINSRIKEFLIFMLKQVEMISFTKSNHILEERHADQIPNWDRGWGLGVGFVGQTTK